MKRILAAGLAGVTALSLAAAPAQAAEGNSDFIDSVREKAKDSELIDGIRDAAEGPKGVVEGALEGAEEGARQGIEKRKLDKKLEEDGYGAAPQTDGAKDMMVGSIDHGSSADQAYKASQAGWILTWIAVAAAGIGAVGFAASQAGLLPNMPNVPF
ncbi:hypothetical protein MHJ95_02820 [Corynebacterium imitans]|uniref:hypothetical protein n=1 Tax=Corynebacterium imitans TaxID=156978 RepID=UPI001EF2D475|nr:hypothetical protein [Corynebacterium imitans]MCG7277931.1 hypothetical protein [Corynebacterium imitans]